MNEKKCDRRRIFFHGGRGKRSDVILQGLSQEREHLAFLVIQGRLTPAQIGSHLTFRLSGHDEFADLPTVRIETIQLVIQRIQQLAIHKDGLGARDVAFQHILESQVRIVITDWGVERDFPTRCVVPATGADAVALPKLTFRADTFAVLLCVIPCSPDGAVVGAIDFFTDFDGIPVDRDVVMFDLHENFLRSICLERRKPSWPLLFGNRNLTTAPSEIFLRSGSAASRSKGSCLYEVVPSGTVEPPVIKRCGI